MASNELITRPHEKLTPWELGAAKRQAAKAGRTAAEIERMVAKLTPEQLEISEATVTDYIGYLLGPMYLTEGFPLEINDQTKADSIVEALKNDPRFKAFQIGWKQAQLDYLKSISQSK